VDAFDLFGVDQPDPEYGVATWQHSIHHRVTLRGPTWPTIEEAKAAASEYADVPLDQFVDCLLDRDRYSSRVYRERLDVVVVFRQGGDVVSSAPMGGSWSPPGG
jgi:hypothetical protein